MVKKKQDIFRVGYEESDIFLAIQVSFILTLNIKEIFHHFVRYT